MSQVETLPVQQPSVKPFGTLCLDWHDTVVDARFGKRKAVEEKLGLVFPVDTFNGGAIHRERQMGWDPVRKRRRPVTKDDYKPCLSHLFIPSVYLDWMRPMQAVEDGLLHLVPYFERIEIVTTAYGAVTHMVDEIVLRYDLPVDDVIHLPAGTDEQKRVEKLKRYALADVAVDNDPQFLLGIEERYGTKPLILLPGEGETGWRAARRLTRAYRDPFQGEEPFYEEQIAVLPAADGWGKAPGLIVPELMQQAA